MEMIVHIDIRFTTDEKKTTDNNNNKRSEWHESFQ